MSQEFINFCRFNYSSRFSSLMQVVQGHSSFKSLLNRYLHINLEYTFPPDIDISEVDEVVHQKERMRTLTRKRGHMRDKTSLGSSYSENYMRFPWMDIYLS